MNFIIKLWNNISTLIKTIIIIIVLLNLVGLIFLTSLLIPKKTTQQFLSKLPGGPTAAPSPSPKPTPIPIPKDYSLKISSQSAGLTVIVDSLFAPKEGTVAVYQNNNGVIGPIYSEAIPQFEPGTNDGNAFILRTALVPGSYFLQLLDDSGKPIKNAKGQPVYQPFIAQ